MKKCFKCGEEKPVGEFYKHPMMGDGHLGKCKSCTRKDTADRIQRCCMNPVWMNKERERCRNKQARYRALGVAAKATQGKSATDRSGGAEARIIKATSRLFSVWLCYDRS